jgi:hypothetical protein
MASDARKIVEGVLGGHMTAKIWTSTYAPVFPFTPQGYAVGALLPMILYLFRWGHRRGRGKFNNAFGSSGKPNIRSVAERLTKEMYFEGFQGDVGKTIFGDLLLTSALENKRHAEGPDDQVQRCFPNHYMSAWIDLPADATALRGVPEMIVALLNDQAIGDTIVPFQESGRYRVGSRIEDNEFIRVFAPGVTTVGALKSDLRSDRFDEREPLGIDQLIMVRLAQACGEAPSKAGGKGMPGPIPNQRSIASTASNAFKDDLLIFFDCYGREKVTPRLALLSMLESAMAIGMTSIMLATINILNEWSDRGRVPIGSEQAQFPIFIDCSSSADLTLRSYSEQSGSLVRQAMSRMPATLMYMRLLDFFVSTESEISRADLPARAPDATQWLELLGSIACGAHAEARDAERFFRGKTRALVEAAANDQTASFRSDILTADNDGRNYGRRLAEALTLAYEDVAGVDKLNQFLTSSLMTDEPNGLARRRKFTIRRFASRGQRRTGDVVSFILTDTVLEYLVHRHLHRGGKSRKKRDLSFPEFLTILRERYGFYVDQSPANMEVPSELLQRNRRVLERRLRDLGLLTGVNDAERMKKLKTRYDSAYDVIANDETAA